MTLVAENIFDNGGCCSGNGNLTSSIQYVDASTARTTEYTYDWHNRRTTTTATDGTTVYITQNTYDNLNRVTQVDQFHTDATVNANLVGHSMAYYEVVGVVKTEKGSV